MDFLLQKNSFIDIDIAVLKELLERQRRLNSFTEMTMHQLSEASKDSTIWSNRLLNAYADGISMCWSIILCSLSKTSSRKGNYPWVSRYIPKTTVLTSAQADFSG